MNKEEIIIRFSHNCEIVRIKTQFMIASIIAYAVIGAVVAFVLNIFYSIVDDLEMVFLCSAFWLVVILLSTGFLVFVAFPAWIIEQFEEWKKSQKGGWQ